MDRMPIISQRNLAPYQRADLHKGKLNQIIITARSLRQGANSLDIGFTNRQGTFVSLSSYFSPQPLGADLKAAGLDNFRQIGELVLGAAKLANQALLPADCCLKLEVITKQLPPPNRLTPDIVVDLILANLTCPKPAAATSANISPPLNSSQIPMKDQQLARLSLRLSELIRKIPVLSDNDVIAFQNELAACLDKPLSIEKLGGLIGKLGILHQKAREKKISLHHAVPGFISLNVRFAELCRRQEEYHLAAIGYSRAGEAALPLMTLKYYSLAVEDYWRSDQLRPAAFLLHRLIDLPLPPAEKINTWINGAQILTAIGAYSSSVAFCINARKLIGHEPPLLLLISAFDHLALGKRDEYDHCVYLLTRKTLDQAAAKELAAERFSAAAELEKNAQAKVYLYLLSAWLDKTKSNFSAAAEALTKAAELEMEFSPRRAALYWEEAAELSNGQANGLRTRAALIYLQLGEKSKAKKMLKNILEAQQRHSSQIGQAFTLEHLARLDHDPGLMKEASALRLAHGHLIQASRNLQEAAEWGNDPVAQNGLKIEGLKLFSTYLLKIDNPGAAFSVCLEIEDLLVFEEEKKQHWLAVSEIFAQRGDKKLAETACHYASLFGR